MIYEDTPFISAQSAINDAVSYMSALVLPLGHEGRDGMADEECLEQVTSLLDGAERVLFGSGVDQNEVGGEFVEGWWVPNLVPEVHDQQAFEASEAIRALNQPMRDWLRTGVTMVMTQEFISKVRSVLLPFAGRLDGEHEYAERQSDMADAQTF